MFWKKKEPKVKAIEITDENFEEMVLKSDKPVMLDFWAAWCGPCRIIGPIVDELAGDYQEKALIGKVDVDKNKRLAAHFQVRSIPTLMFFEKGKLVEKYAGLVPKPNIEEILDGYIAGTR